MMFPTAIEAALDSTALGTGTDFLSTVLEKAKPSFLDTNKSTLS
jgi:hypothetical protein